MRKYCLTYDAKDSDKWKPQELKLKIAKALIAKGAENVTCFVASTLTFEDLRDTEHFSDWHYLIIDKFKEDIFYSLFEIAINTYDNSPIERVEGNLELAIEFQLLLHTP